MKLLPYQLTDKDGKPYIRIKQNNQPKDYAP